MNLAARDIRHNLGRFALTTLGVGMLLMVVMGMGGIYRGVVEDAHDLQVGARAQREDHVARAEPRVDAPVHERLPEQLPQPAGGAGEPIRSCGVREMVQAHDQHCDSAPIRPRHRGPTWGPTLGSTGGAPPPRASDRKERLGGCVRRRRGVE